MKKDHRESFKNEVVRKSYSCLGSLQVTPLPEISEIRWLLLKKSIACQQARASEKEENSCQKKAKNTPWAKPMPLEDENDTRGNEERTAEE